MPLERFTDALATQLNGAINSSVTTVVVSDASTMPLMSFRIIVESEIMYVSSRSSNTLTVVRGYEGTTAASHADTKPVNHVITAGALEQIKQNFLSDLHVIPPEDSISVDDDHFDDENFSGWTKVWHGTSPVIVETERDHSLSLEVTGTSVAARFAAYLKAKTPSPGDWIQIGYQNFLFEENGHHVIGVGFSNTNTFNTGEQILSYASLKEKQVYAFWASGFNAQNSAGGKGMAGDFNGGTTHHRLIWHGFNSGNAMCEILVSQDGISWETTGTKSFGSPSYGGVAPGYMGIFLTTWDGTNQKAFNVKYVRFSF